MIMKLVKWVKGLVKGIKDLIAKLLGKIKDLLAWMFRVVVG